MRRFFSRFGDPVRRPRYVVWGFVALMLFVLLWAGGLIGTSFEWFCEEPCHIVHYDNTLTYKAGSHNQVACVACHEPVKASPLTYTWMKIYVIPDLFATIGNTFELPLNADSETALAMPTEQCTQCHNLATRTVNPSSGMIINHDIHTEDDVACTLCHNRVAHPEENVTYVLPGDKKHENWMTMDACFRCHGQQTDAAAPGACEKCHTPEFKLVPASHEATGWYALYGESGGHAQAAREESAAVGAARVHEESEEVENVGEEEPELPPAASVNSCYTCHGTGFCSDCHGVQMPHPEAFKKNHSQLGYAKPETCAKCHARSAEEAKGTAFCNACHHPASSPGGEWISEHSAGVAKDGADSCFTCHGEAQCSYCHVNGVSAGRARLKDDFAK